MSTPQLEESLLLLAAAWRAKAKRIEDKFQPLSPAQAQVAVESINTCASDLEDEVRGFRRSRPVVK